MKREKFLVAGTRELGWGHDLETGEQHKAEFPPQMGSNSFWHGARLPLRGSPGTVPLPEGVHKQQSLFQDSLSLLNVFQAEGKPPSFQLTLTQSISERFFPNVALMFLQLWWVTFILLVNYSHLNLLWSSSKPWKVWQHSKAGSFSCRRSSLLLSALTLKIYATHSPLLVTLLDQALAEFVCKTSLDSSLYFKLYF